MTEIFETEETDDGEERTRLNLKNLDDGEAYPAELIGHSDPIPGDYGPYIFATFRDGVTEEEHEVLVSSSMNAPGFLNPEFDPETGDQNADYEETILDGVQGVENRPRGKSLVECIAEAPLNDGTTVFKKFVNETEDGREWTAYWFGATGSSDEDSDGEAVATYARGERATAPAE